MTFFGIVVVLFLICYCLSRCGVVSDLSNYYKSEPKRINDEESSVQSCTRGANLDNNYNTVPQETDASFVDKNVDKKYQSQNQAQRILSLDDYALQEESKHAVKHVGNVKLLKEKEPSASF